MKALYGILLLCSFLATHAELPGCLEACWDLPSCEKGDCECLQVFYNCVETAECDPRSKDVYALGCRYDNYKLGCDNDCATRNISDCELSMDPCKFQEIECFEEKSLCECEDEYFSCVRGYDCYAEDVKLENETENWCVDLNEYSGCSLECPRKCEITAERCFHDWKSCLEDPCSCTQYAYYCIFEECYEGYRDQCLAEECELDCTDTINICRAEDEACTAVFDECQNHDYEELKCECIQAEFECNLAKSCADQALDAAVCKGFRDEDCPELECHLDQYGCAAAFYPCNSAFQDCVYLNEEVTCECVNALAICLSQTPCTNDDPDKETYYQICVGFEEDVSCGIDCGALFATGTLDTTVQTETATTENSENTAISESTGNTGSATNTEITGTANTEITSEASKTGITEDTTETAKQTQSSDQQEVDDAGKLYALYSVAMIAIIWTSVF